VGPIGNRAEGGELVPGFSGGKKEMGNVTMSSRSAGKKRRCWCEGVCGGVAEGEKGSFLIEKGEKSGIKTTTSSPPGGGKIPMRC